MTTTLTNADSSARTGAYCTAVHYRLLDILQYLEKRGETTTHFRSSNVVHRALSSGGDAFYFSYGTLVLWGLTKEQEHQLLHEVKAFETTPYDVIETEEYRYTVGLVAKIVRDDMTLPANDMLTKLAFSHGLAQSVQLSVFEKLIQRRIESSKKAPESLARFGHISMSQREIGQMMGTIMIERSSINLHTDILDTPEFFWEYSDLEPLYRLIAQDLDIASRIFVLNRRLDIVKDLFEMLSNEVQHRHSSRLEWIVIGLIFIEVVVSFAKDIFKLI